MKLEDKMVLVTGGGSGIGRALAAEFIRRGNRIAVGGWNRGKLTAVAVQFPGLEIVRCDITSPDDRTRLVDAVRTAFGGSDVLVNNAGVVHAMNFLAGRSFGARGSRRRYQPHGTDPSDRGFSAHAPGVGRGGDP